MQPNPQNALLALTARLVADNQPIALLELADMAEVSHDVMRSALNELKRPACSRITAAPTRCATPRLNT